MEDQEEKTIDIVVQEYEEKLKEQEKLKQEEIAKIREEHAQEIRAILSGKQIPQEKPTEEEEEKGFIATEIEKTKKKLKLK